MLAIGSLIISAAVVYGQTGDFDTALKNELLANHRRHIPEITVNGNEVTLTYGPEEQWKKSTAHDEVAKMDASGLNFFNAIWRLLRYKDS